MATNRNPRYEWYQTSGAIVVSILQRGVNVERCRVNVGENSFVLLVDDNPILSLNLAHPVLPGSETIKCTPSKIEVKMNKTTGDRWEQLEQLESSGKSEIAGHSSRNWDKVEKEVIAEAEKEEPSGDAAVQSLFQKIYRDADDDTKKAMMKSYSESGGTVLSTNWKDIGAKKTEIKPPDGMEYKRYEQ